MKNLLKGVFVFFVGFFCVLLVGEGYLRLCGISERSDVEYVAGYGKMLRSDQEMVRHSEGFSITRSNAHRHLGPDRGKERRPYTYRVALLGDSFIEGYQLFERNHLRYVMEVHLNDRRIDSFSWEVLNFGRSNFDLGTMYAYHQGFVKEFSPDLTLFFLSLDDLEPVYEERLLPATFLEDDQLVVRINSDSTYLKAFQQSSTILQHSHLAYFLNKARHRWQRTSAWNILTGKKESGSPKASTPVSSNVSAFSYRILAALNDPCIWVVWRDRRPAPQALVEWMEERNQGWLDLQPLLQELAEEGNDPFYWAGSKQRGHWNQAAHLAIGKYVAEEVVRRTDFLHFSGSVRQKNVGNRCP